LSILWNNKSSKTILSEENSLLNVLKYEKENVFLIIDSMRAYFRKQKLIDFVYHMVDYTQIIGKNGITVLADKGCFLNNSK